jgi:hypothetical protein
MQAKQLAAALFISAFSLFSAFSSVSAQTPEKQYRKHKIRSVYFSWGYNEEWYTKSTLHVDQYALGNNFDLIHVLAHDNRGWNYQFFQQQLTIPQYNYRLGFYINEKQDLAIEVNFDHTKYNLNDGQYINVSGTINHQPATGNLLFSAQNGFYYYLDNGANFLLFNIVKRLGIYHTYDYKLHFDFTGKAGIGPVIPHVENSFFGYENEEKFQVGGWNTGVETALRATFLHYGYLEFSQKVDYARYSNLEIYGGTAKQNFGTYELILSAGVIIPTSHKTPMFFSENKTAEENK